MTGKIGNSVVPIYWGEKKWFQTKIERERERDSYHLVIFNLNLCRFI